jgi:ABC-2 type transport system ATP-binding protein
VAEPAANNKSEFAVSVRNLEKRFGDFVAVNRISFDVVKGEVFGFLGPNGAGKSTTIRMLCGILVPSGGSGVVAGLDILTQKEEIKSNIGYMSQKFSLYDDLRVEENIDFYSGIYRIPKGKRQERKEWVIEMAGLKEHRRALTKTLSGGWKQRLSLGCAILHEPKVLFLDEPTSGVDPMSRRQFWELIYSLSDTGVTVFVTTHYMDEAEYCDRLGLIYRGELIAVGTPTELKHCHMQETVVEIVCDRFQDALTMLSGMEGVREVALFGRTLHAAVDDEQKASEAIHKRLEEQGVKVEDVRRIEPSLEDVFVSLVEARDRVEQQKEVAR